MLFKLGRRSNSCKQYEQPASNPELGCSNGHRGRDSTYFHRWRSRSDCSHSENPATCSALLTNGSQWSANGNDTARTPVTQLETRQKTIPSCIASPGAALVSTKGL